jgi:hypothetical protein
MATSPITSCHVLVTQRENFQQGQGFWRLFVRGHILQDSPSLSVLGDDQGLSLPRELRQNLRSVGLEVGDRLDMRRVAHDRARYSMDQKIATMNGEALH